ncbi:hypothetical protein GYMLUDRAFT_249825 [Collybiopsis luxurians FD-317 M1]|uniref:T6SS Phospholipase effector Tle1-like catalytic domain-containing protein n=1 Tax=Collybiopsis luxurians FD-317 M1 TaxID=944289 RepID=A0A0D0CGL2_9AGAR|nr:hypothetical protein GYMLUDRAFT_249825 [Collybiopsis luxurians FD-317 M1]
MKRIVVACDGTSQWDIDIPSNVKRICNALSCPSGGIQQLIFCQFGIGSEDLGLTGFVQFYVQALIEGIDDRIEEAYTSIMNNYLPGDEIFIFGFSRGAFAARVLANFIARLEVYRTPEYTWAFKCAMKAYKDGTLDGDIETHKYHTAQDGGRFLKVHEVGIEVVGCWDTVASLGIPWTGVGEVSGKYKHLSPSLVKGIKHAFHALALDEYRHPFSLTMWHLPKDAEVAKIDLQQCWFPGAHTNVGGGYNNQALADLSRLDDRRLSSVTVTVAVGWNMRMGQTWMWKHRTPSAHGVDDKETKEIIHPSVWARWQSSRENGGELKDRPGVYAPKALTKGAFERELGVGEKGERERGSGNPGGSVPG